MLISKKNNYYLINLKSPNKNIYNLIIKNIPNSIFSILDFQFLKQIVKLKIIKLYLVKNKGKISSIITTVSIKNYNNLKNRIFIYLLFRPIKLLNNIFFLFKIINRDSNEINYINQKKYLHLLHLIIFKKCFNKINLKEKDLIISFFFKKIIRKNNANYLYLCYEKNNYKAHKFYKRNKFVIYKRNKTTVFLRKKFF